MRSRLLIRLRLVQPPCESVEPVSGRRCDLPAGHAPEPGHLAEWEDEVGGRHTAIWRDVDEIRRRALASDDEWPPLTPEARDELRRALDPWTDEDDADDAIGTVRWFGTAWPSPETRAPICDPRSHVDTPVGAVCPCGYVIRAGDSGIGVPWLGSGQYLWHHRKCWLQAIGIPSEIVVHLPGDAP